MKFYERLGNLISKRAFVFLVLSTVITIIMVFGIFKIEIKTSTDMMVKDNNAVMQDTKKFENEFGGESLILLLSGDKNNILKEDNWTQMQEMQRKIEKLGQVRSVTSPVTIANMAAEQVFPHQGENALFSIQLNSGLSFQELSDITKDIQTIIDHYTFSGLTKTFSGTPAITSALQESIYDNLRVMILAVIILMTLILLIVFPFRWRLLSLPVVLMGAVWTLGIMGYVGIPLSLITIAGLPIIIGLGMDFSLQFHNRYEEELSVSSSPTVAATQAIHHMGKAVGMAVGIMSAAFLTLLFVDMPMIQHFGIVLAIGVCIIYLLDIALLIPLLTLRDKKNPRPQKCGHETIIERGLGKLASGIVKHSVIVLLIPILLAGVGYSLDHSLKKESELEKLMPQNAQALLNMNKIRDITGTTMALQWMIEADDVTDPNVIPWICNMHVPSAPHSYYFPLHLLTKPFSRQPTSFFKLNLYA